MEFYWNHGAWYKRYYGKGEASALYDEGENINPLRKGETKNFADILSSQMAMSRLHADRVMKESQVENIMT